MDALTLALSPYFLSADDGCNLYDLPVGIVLLLEDTGTIRLLCHPNTDVNHVQAVRVHADKKSHVRVMTHSTPTMGCILLLVLWDGNWCDKTHPAYNLRYTAVEEFYAPPAVTVITAAPSFPDATAQTKVQSFVAYLQRTYPEHSSLSEECNAPNFNTTALSRQITAMTASRAYSHLTVSSFIEYLSVANKCYAQEMYGFSKTVLSCKVWTKCKASGLWLFCRSRSLDHHYIQRVIQEDIIASYERWTHFEML